VYHNEFPPPERIVECRDTTRDLAVVFRKTQIEDYSNSDERYCDRPGDCSDYK